MARRRHRFRDYRGNPLSKNQKYAIIGVGALVVSLIGYYFYENQAQAATSGGGGGSSGGGGGGGGSSGGGSYSGGGGGGTNQLSPGTPAGNVTLGPGGSNVPLPQTDDTGGGGLPTTD
jgi:hypothetical protein